MLDIMGCSLKLSHKVDLAVIGYGARLSSLRSLLFRFIFSSFLSTSPFLHNIQ